MESILSLIEKCQAQIPGANEEFLNRMTPLVKKYASKIHFMEYEDSVQELYTVLLETLPYLNVCKGEAKCLSYMKTAIIHRYHALCTNYLSKPQSEDIEKYSAALESPPVIDDTYYDVLSYINSFPPDSMKFQILFKCFSEDKTDSEIAQELKVSRQYVNRIKKQLISGYFMQK